MRFTYILKNQSDLHNSYFVFTKDALTTRNEPPFDEGSYCVCGDLVLSFDWASLAIYSINGELSHHEMLPRNSILLPENILHGVVVVGDTREGNVFSINKLNLELSQDSSVLHAGNGESSVYVQQSPSLIFGLDNEQLTDIYITLSTAT